MVTWADDISKDTIAMRLRPTVTRIDEAPRTTATTLRPTVTGVHDALKDTFYMTLRPWI